MNERTREYAFAAGLDMGTIYDLALERFVAAVRQDERTQCAKDYLQDCANAIEKARREEREACAKLCDDWRGHVAANLAAVIRGRTE
jgi:hypothetical protein